ncbi:MAG: ABC transporter ATP-binding protein [Peptococcaceae bacterium]
MAEVILQGVTKSFGQTTAVANIDLKINDGEFLVLVGPSGCGKSTTLRMVAGLEKPTTGEIYIDNKKVTYLEPKDRDIAMVFQNYALYPHKNVFNNMAFGLHLRKFPKDEIKKRVDEAARLLGMSDYLERFPKQLSGGQRQRVALGRAIVRHPKVFLMDEPLSNLDAKLRVQTRAELIKLHQRLKTTTIYVTHDQTEAMTMGSRIVVMKDGIVQQFGISQEIYERPQNIFVAGFIGSPPMNFINGSIEVDHNKTFLRNSSINLKLTGSPLTMESGKKVVLGIRPESLEVVSDAGGSEENSIFCKVEVVEHIGSESIIHTRVESGEEVVICLNGSKRVPAVDSIIKVKPGEGNIHLFDAENGNCLTSVSINRKEY